MNWVSIFIASLLIMGGNMAYAQVLPDAGTLLQQQQNLDRLPQTPLDKPQLEEKPPVKKPPTDQVTIFVHTFKIRGDTTAFSHKRLLALLDNYINTHLSISDLQQAANIITNFYQQHGYFLARAYLPKQDVTDGIVTIAIQEGLLESDDGILINGNDLRLRSDYAKRIIDNVLSPNQPLKQQQLERGLLLLNDLPGITANANLKQGVSPGTTRIELNLAEASLFNSNLRYDNYGSRYTGSERATANVSLNNLTGFGDQFALSGTKASNGDYNYINLNYAIPLGVSGLRAAINYSYLNYGISKELKALDAKGDAKTWNVNLRYPLIRTRKQSLYLTGSYDRKDFYNESFGTETSDKQLDIATIGLNLKYNDRIWGGGYTLANFSISLGKLDLSNNAINLAQDQSAIGPNTQGNFQKLSWSATRVQYGANRLVLVGSLHGQFASKNLDSSEKFQLGGPTGVRAYPNSEATGDDGVRATLEAHYQLGFHPIFGSFNVQTFYDWGRIRRFHNDRKLNLTTKNSYSLSGYGIGISVNKAKKYDMRLQWAHKIGSNPLADSQGNDSDGKDDKSRVWLSFSAYF